MKTLFQILTIAFVCTFLSQGEASAQFGASISHDRQSSPNWETLIADSDSLMAPGTFVTIGLNYWLRPKNLRIEILPEIAYRRNFGSSGSTVIEAKTHSIDLNLNALFYIFDLGNDCNCPTFSKQGNFLQKGFYLEASAGGSFRQYSLLDTVDGEDRGLSKSDGVLGKAGIGAGLDFGLSDLITLSPWVKYEWHFGGDWDQLSQYSNGESDLEASALAYLRIGLRLIFRPDYRPFR